MQLTTIAMLLTETDMIKNLTESLPTILVAIIAAGGTLFVAKINKGSTSEMSLINELQEENKIRKEEIISLQKELKKNKDYTEELRKWISEEKPPPPPPYPDN